MGLFKRVNDIVSANLNDMIERFESPETMLRQAIREMDDAIARQMESAARVIADERLVEGELTRHHEQSAALHVRAREALLRSDDAAARRLLARRQEHEKLIAALDDQLATVRATGTKLRRQLAAMRVRRAEAERTLHVLVARDRAAAARRQFAAPHSAPALDSTGFSRFERLRQQVERHEAETEAMLELAAVDCPESSIDSDVETALDQLKQEIQA